MPCWSWRCCYQSSWTTILSEVLASQRKQELSFLGGYFSSFNNFILNPEKSQAWLISVQFNKISNVDTSSLHNPSPSNLLLFLGLLLLHLLLLPMMVVFPFRLLSQDDLGRLQGKLCLGTLWDNVVSPDGDLVLVIQRSGGKEQKLQINHTGNWLGIKIYQTGNSTCNLWITIPILYQLIYLA